jgi:hypothetical protein
MDVLDIFNKVFLETTDPLTEYSRLFDLDVGFSIFMHIIMYSIVYLVIIRLFDLPDKLMYFIPGLAALMVFGYFGRLARSKSLYRVLSNKGSETAAAETSETAREQTLSTIRGGYFTWCFLA